MTPLLAVLLFAAAPVEGAVTEVTEECHVALLDLEGVGLSDREAHIPRLLTDTLATELGEVLGCKVITQADIAQMLNVEAERAACGIAEASCLAEIGEAFGVARVIGGTVGKLGPSYSIQARLLNIKTAEVLRRVDIDVDGEVELRAAAREAADKLLDRAPKTAANDTGSPALFWGGVGVVGLGAIAAVSGVVVLVGVESGFEDAASVKVNAVRDGWTGVALTVVGLGAAVAGGAMMWVGVQE